MTDYDLLFKNLLSTFFGEFVALFLPKMRPYLDGSSLVFLDTDTYSDSSSTASTGGSTSGGAIL